MFRRTALTCNDLLEVDAHLLADNVASTYRMADAARSERGAGRATAVAEELPDLKEMNLYSSVEPTDLIETPDAEAASM